MTGNSSEKQSKNTNNPFSLNEKSVFKGIEKKRIFLFLIAFSLIAITLFSFYGVKDNSFLNMDDDVYVTDNARVKEGISWENIKWSFSTIYFGFYYPLTWLSHMLDYEIYGLNAGGHHITSMIIHIVNTLILFFALYRMTRKEWRSFIVAGLFAVHPLHVESVAWISERKDILSAFFFFLGLMFYSYYVEKPSIKRYILVMLSYLLGLLSKPMVITFPFVLLLLDYWPLERMEIFEEKKRKGGDGKERWQKVWKLVLEKIPLFLFIPLFSFLTFYAQKKTGAVADIVSAPISQRISNAIISYVAYLKKMFIPLNLIPYYPFPMKKIEIGVVLINLAILVAITFFIIIYAKKHKYFLSGWLWYLGMLVPVIGIVQIGGQAMADRYTYIPLLGTFIIVVFYLAELCEKNDLFRISAMTASVVILAGFVYLTKYQIKNWKDNVTLFSYTLKVDPQNFFAHNSLGSALLLEGKTDEAINHFLEAIKNEPGYYSAHFNLASAYLELGKYQDAVEHYKLSFIEKEDAGGFNNVGFALLKQKKYDEAEVWFKKAIELDSNLLDARINLANTYRDSGKLEEAIAQYKEILKIKPDSLSIVNQLGLALAKTGKLQDALEVFKRCVDSNPNSEEYQRNYGNALSDLGRNEEAIEHYQKALQIRPDSYLALNSYGLALAKMGKLKESIEKFKSAVMNNPNFIDGYINLGYAQLQTGDIDGAIFNFEKALKIDPNSELALSNYNYALGLKRKRGKN